MGGLAITIAASSCGDQKNAGTANSMTSKTDFKFIDPANMDTTVRPGDDFFKYANGGWLKTAVIPGDKTRWGSFDELADRTNKAVRELLDGVSAKNNAQKGTKEYNVANFYKSGMDSANINKIGINAIKPELDQINAITNQEQLMDVIVSLTKKGVPTLFGAYVGPDDREVTKIIAQFGQAGLGLPSKDYYTDKDEKSVANREAYKKLIQDFLQMSGQDEATAAKNATAVFNIENKLAGASMYPAEMRDPQKLYNKFSLADLNKKTPNIDWVKLFDKFNFKGQDSLLVSNPKYYTVLSAELKATPIEDWKQYLRFHLMSDMSAYIGDAAEQLSFKFYGQTLSGQKEMKARWERVMGIINHSVGDQLGELYVEKNFRPEAKEKMKTLVKNLQEAFGERIKGLDWMSDVTKEKAMIKLKSFVEKIGYPDKWKDYSGLEIVPDNYAQNVLKANEFAYNTEIAKFGKPVDRNEWFMTPNTVNAYYNPAFNEIVFPAAILQFPFFDFNADDAINYGGIGAVIGHEMTHGFDDQGAQYAADGNLKNWWTPEDEKKFKDKTNVLVKQFNAYTVLDSVPVNGELTLGENIADLGGLAIAYQAFKKTKQGQSEEKIDGFTPDQRFFMSWAQIWRGKATKERSLQLIKIDPHSPGEWRANGPLSNFEPFYKAFNVKEGDKMYRPDAERAKIW
ncbi:MAG: M13 family peptidase [Sphingobacteriales bacterium]|nr:MAG: M13 family peptidase [Sphingobacteriales bacterium]